MLTLAPPQTFEGRGPQAFTASPAPCCIHALRRDAEVEAVIGAVEGSRGIHGGECGDWCSWSLTSPQGPTLIETVLEMIAFDYHSASIRLRAPQNTRASSLQTWSCLLIPITVCTETFASAKGPMSVLIQTRSEAEPLWTLLVVFFLLVKINSL